MIIGRCRRRLVRDSIRRHESRRLPPAILLMGPTASGKTAVAMAWPTAFRSN
jgi:DNA helicase TIP49 (TBP-interacting protein)